MAHTWQQQKELDRISAHLANLDVRMRAQFNRKHNPEREKKVLVIGLASIAVLKVLHMVGGV